VLLLGLLLFGFRLSDTVWPQKRPFKNPSATAAAITPSPENTPVVPATTSSPESAPVVPAAAATPAHTRLAKVPAATLDIEVEHNFTSAQLSVWVDDHKAYTHLLEGSDKKRLVVFHGVQGHESHALQLAPGKHRVRVEVASGLDSYDQSGTVQSQFVSGKEKVLRIRFNKHKEMTLSLQ
jgi:hypothetical protein